jgi:hypothetical protein
MKTIAKLFVFTSLLLLFGVTAQAQFSEPADAHATIVAPISIHKEVDLNFGDLAINNTAGTLELEASATAARTESGGVTLPTSTNTPTAAEFTIHGVPLATYTIEVLPVQLIITRATGTEEMEVDTWSCNESTWIGTLDGSGDETIYIGGLLHVDASEVAGVYNSLTPFQVTVNYN